jgi:hypothetical protein
VPENLRKLWSIAIRLQVATTAQKDEIGERMIAKPQVAGDNMMDLKRVIVARRDPAGHAVVPRVVVVVQASHVVAMSG